MSAKETDPPPGAAGGLGVRGHATSNDGAMPMRVLVLDRGGGTRARCAGIDGVPQTIETALIAPLEPGAIVLVKGGVALARLDTEWVP